MAKNDGGLSGSINGDCAVTLIRDGHVSERTGPAVDGKRPCDREWTVDAAAETIYLGRALIVGSQGVASRRLLLSPPCGRDKQRGLRLGRTRRKQKHHHKKRRAH